MQVCNSALSASIWTPHGAKNGDGIGRYKGQGWTRRHPRTDQLEPLKRRLLNLSLIK